MPAWHLHLGDWRSAPALPPSLRGDNRPHVVISDPPYDARTHDGRRSGDEVNHKRQVQVEGIAYPPLDEASARIAVEDMVEWWHPEWVVLSGSHVTWGWFSAALGEAGYYVFAPVPWVKPACAPRKQGDGPDSACEWFCIARPRRRLRRYGHRPGYYTHASVHGNGVAGVKPLGLMRQLVLDYSEPGDVVVDPYAGTGTTLLAALLEGRNAWGAEINPATHARANARLVDEWDRQPTLPMTVERGTERQLEFK